MTDLSVDLHRLKSLLQAWIGALLSHPRETKKATAFFQAVAPFTSAQHRRSHTA